MNKEDIGEIQAMIDFTNIEVRNMIDSVGCCEAETNHWIDQFYKMLKVNANKLNISNKKNEGEG